MVRFVSAGLVEHPQTDFFGQWYTQSWMDPREVTPNISKLSIACLFFSITGRDEN